MQQQDQLKSQTVIAILIKGIDIKDYIRSYIII